jgi:hypothetical protein
VGAQIIVFEFEERKTAGIECLQDICAAGPPSPDGRRCYIKNGDIEARFFEALQERYVEVRTVYDNDRTRFFCQGGFSDLAPEAQQTRERRNGLYGTDDRELGGRPKGFTSGFLRLRAEHAPHSVAKAEIA